MIVTCGDSKTVIHRLSIIQHTDIRLTIVT